MASLSLENISKIYPNGFEAVKDFNLEIEDKDFIIFVGPSGCGKSTTLRMIAGLEDISLGTLKIDDKVVNDVEAKDRDIAMVFQSYALYPHLSVYDNMAFGLKLKKVPKDVIDEKVKYAAKILDLEKLLDRKPKALSGGQRQRIIIARCLVVTPKIIFADEPISALDVSLQAQVINMLMDLQDKYKLSMLLIAHDLAVVRQIADQIKIMYFGEIVESAPSSEIYKNAQHPYTKVLLKAAPSISKGLEDAGFDIDLKPGDIPDPAKPMPGCPFCTRCIYADERCMKERPEETEVSPGHTVRCHKAGQI